MYGTVALMRVKPGMEALLIEHFHYFEAARRPGVVAVYCYSTDANAQEYYVTVVFESKEAYRSNAESSEQDRLYRQMLPLLESEPEWHDGEIVYALNQALFSAIQAQTPTVQSKRSSL